jgi:hypothetical protein
MVKVRPEPTSIGDQASRLESGLSGASIRKRCFAQSEFLSILIQAAENSRSACCRISRELPQSFKKKDGWLIDLPSTAQEGCHWIARAFDHAITDSHSDRAVCFCIGGMKG